MKREFNFAEEFGEIDEKLVEQAGKEWNRKRYDVFQLYSRKIAGVAIFAMLCIALAGNSKVQAAVKEFTTKIGEILGFTEDLSPYTEIINQTQTKNGISLTLKEVILDDKFLLISVHTDFGQNEEMQLWINEEKTQINGQHLLTYESMQSVDDNEDISQSKRDMVLAEFYEDQILPEGDVHVHLVLEAGDLEKAFLMPNISAGGTEEFVYDFAITLEELKAKTVKQKIDLTVGGSGMKERNLTLKELTMNDLYCGITAEGVSCNDEWINQYELKLKGTDSFGNLVSLAGSSFFENGMLFTTDFAGDYENGEVIEEDAFQMSVPDKDCAYLDLQLYERKLIWEDTSECADEEDGVQVSGDVYEMYSEEENYGWVPIGKPFRIIITQEEEMTLCVLPVSQEEEIGNHIPQWVSDADQALPMHVMTSTDLENFNDYAKKIFPSFYDDGWTKEQSDKVYLGQGIEMYHLDDSAEKWRSVYYPVILNGVIVSVLDVYEDLHSHEMSWQAGPQLVNQLNALIQQMASYDTETTLLLGYNNNNVIGMIGSFNGSDIGTVWNNYYILDIDHVEYKGVDTKQISMKEVTKGIVVNALEPLCTERSVSWEGEQ